MWHAGALVTQSRIEAVPLQLKRDALSTDRQGSPSFILLCCCCCCQVALVVSDSVQPHRRQPTRLPRPWDSPGKNTRAGCHFLPQCMKVKNESEVAQSCPTLSDPMDCSLPGSSVHGIFQARVLEWGAIAFSTFYFSKTSCCQNSKLQWYFEGTVLFDPHNRKRSAFLLYIENEEMKAKRSLKKPTKDTNVCWRPLCQTHALTGSTVMNNTGHRQRLGEWRRRQLHVGKCYGKMLGECIKCFSSV